MALVAVGKTKQAGYPDGSPRALSVYPLRVVLKAVVSLLTLIGAPLVVADWPLHGADTFEQRQSPLTQIHPDNIQDLGLAWSFDTGTRRGLEASRLGAPMRAVMSLTEGLRSWGIGSLSAPSTAA